MAKSKSPRPAPLTISTLSDMVFEFAKDLAPESPAVRLRVEFEEHTLVLIIKNTFLRQVIASECPSRDQLAAACEKVFPGAQSSSLEIRMRAGSSVKKIVLAEKAVFDESI